VGLEVIAVSDGHGAIVLALASGADVVVTDAKPRGAIDGIEVTRRLRNDDRTKSIRVVVLNTAGDDEGRTKARAVGCHAILERHCEPALLASEIRRLVAERTVKESPHRAAPRSELSESKG
jgi:CheY-like chemotaxis protein